MISNVWIPAAAELPGDLFEVVIWVVGGKLLICPGDPGYMDTGYYDSDKKTWKDCDDKKVKVSHWMYVPKPQGELEHGYL